MQEIIIIAVLLVLTVAVFFRYHTEQRKWKQKISRKETEYSTILKQADMKEELYQKNRNELEQLRMENKNLQLEAGRLKEQLREISQKLEKWQKQSSQIGLNMHLYTQLVKEQCETEGAQNRCDRMLRMCNILLQKEEGNQE